MKRVLIFPIFLCSLLIGNAYAACVAGAKTYTSCNAGYYLSGGLCLTCPSGGTSAAGATSITSCYLPSGTTGSDSTGSYTYTSNCYYSN